MEICGQMRRLGAQAIEQPIGKLEVGKRADLVVLDDSDVIF